eukprot:gene17849-5614_t
MKNTLDNADNCPRRKTFVSTRGDEVTADFWGALINGIPSNGGCFMPQEIPKLSEE